MLQNARVTAFTVSELLRENQQEGEGKINPPPPPTLHQPSRLGLKFGFKKKADQVLRFFEHLAFLQIEFQIN